MSKPTLLTAAIAAVLLLPGSAYAYTPPQDALFDENIDDGFLLPPTKREVDARVAEQQRQSAARRAQEQAATYGGGTVEDEEIQEEDDLHGAASDEEDDAGSTTDDPELSDVLKSIEQTLSGIREDSQSVENRRRERLLERLEEDGTGTRNAAPDYRYNGQEEFHSGAPLAHTGPESWLAGGVLAGAIGWTLWRSRRMGRQEAVIR